MKKNLIFIVLTLSCWAFGNIQQTDSLSFGNNVSANGNSSIGIGNGIQSVSFQEVVVGAFNDYSAFSTPNSASWTATDPIFVIGNGSSSSSRSNALFILKNGDIFIPKPQGDIPMGEYGNQ